jgi:cob(I)alamin adenosyltransferase
MKIYTRTGDEGETGLLGGGRVSKADVRVEAYGTVDELNAALGVAREAVSDEAIRQRLRQVQNDLFSLGAFLATPGANDGSARPSAPPLPGPRVREMEEWIDDASSETPELKSFILPGGTGGAAALHLARTICRRAERAVVRLAEHQEVHPLVLRFLNRLSDLLFAFARLENWRNEVPDSIWEKGGD